MPASWSRKSLPARKESEARMARHANSVSSFWVALAIVSALIVEAAGQRFAIPQLNVTELVGVSDRSGARIETINTSPVLRLRDRLLPLV